jgi:hypothetical protein
MLPKGGYMTKTVEVLDALMGSGKATHEVYIASSGEYTLYVGEGKIGRHRHCSGGVSHVYGLNLCHFTNTPIKVEVVHLSSSKEYCEAMESDLIYKLKPCLNKTLHDNTRKADLIRNLLSKNILTTGNLDHLVGGFILSVENKSMRQSVHFTEFFEEVPYITSSKCFRIRPYLLEDQSQLYKPLYETNT